MEALQQRRLAPDAKAQYDSSAAKFVSQAGSLLAQLPAAAAAKELKRGGSPSRPRVAPLELVLTS
jgi:hypothetical protein